MKHIIKRLTWLVSKLLVTIFIGLSYFTILLPICGIIWIFTGKNHEDAITDWLYKLEKKVDKIV